MSLHQAVLNRRFRAGPFTPEQISRVEAVESAFVQVADVVCRNCPTSGYLTQALHYLEVARDQAERAIGEAVSQ